MTNDMFKQILEYEKQNMKKDCENNSEDDKYYALINKQTGTIIQLSTSNRKYYKGINSLYKAYIQCLNNTNISKDDIGFKEFKLIEHDLSDEDYEHLLTLINNPKINNCTRQMKDVVKVNNHFFIRFIKENKTAECVIRCCKSKHYEHPEFTLGYHVFNIERSNWYDSYYTAQTMPELRELLLAEVKKGNIEIPEARLYIKD